MFHALEIRVSQHDAFWLARRSTRINNESWQILVESSVRNVSDKRVLVDSFRLLVDELIVMFDDQQRLLQLVSQQVLFSLQTLAS